MSKNCVYKTILALTVLELIFAHILLACGVTSLVKQSKLFFVGHGIWGSVFLIITSAIGVHAARKQKVGLYVAHLVMAILSCGLILPFMLTLLGIEVESDSRWSYRPRSQVYMSRSQSSTNTVQAQYRYMFWNIQAVPGEITGLIFAGLAFILFVISASFTCCALCKCRGETKRELIDEAGVVTYTLPNSNYPIQFSGYPVNPRYPPTNPEFASTGQMPAQFVVWKNGRFMLPQGHGQQPTVPASEGNVSYPSLPVNLNVEKSADIY